MQAFHWEKLDGEYYRDRVLYDEIDETASIICDGLLVTEDLHVSTLGKYSKHWTLNNLKGSLVSSEIRQGLLRVVTASSLFDVKRWVPLEFETTHFGSTEQIWDYRNGIAITKNTQDVWQYSSDSGWKLLISGVEHECNLLNKSYWDVQGETIILLNSNKVYIYHEGNTSTVMKDQQWHQVQISPTSTKVAFFNQKTNLLQVHTVDDWSKPLYQFKLETYPLKLSWCGDHCIAAIVEANPQSGLLDEIRLYGPAQDYVTFWYPNEKIKVSSLRSLPEGLEVLTNRKLHLISKVTAETTSVLRLGSVDPGAMLLDCYEVLQTKPANAIDNLRKIDLLKGINDCLITAKHELDITLQKKLLSAVSFGKSVLPYQAFDSNKFVEACQEIKIINYLHECGVPLTYESFQRLGYGKVIKLMINLNKYYEALTLSKLVGHNFEGYISDIFNHWAIGKIRLDSLLDDQELLVAIQNQLEITGFRQNMGVITTEAFKEGRFNLAKQLALMEPSIVSKISQLMTLSETNLALKECLRGHYPELSLSLILLLSKKLSWSQLSKLLILHMGSNYLYPYLKRQDKGHLYDFYRQTDKYKDLGDLILMTSNKEQSKDTISQIIELHKRVATSNEMKRNLNLMKRQEKLTEWQELHSAKERIDIRNLSLDTTLVKLIESNRENSITEFVKKFNISDKKFYFIKCRTLVVMKDFEGLRNFALANKSPPVGYRIFYDTLKRHGHLKEAADYISLISGLSYEATKQLYIDCKAYQKAIVLASREKDILGLKYLYKIIPPNEPQLKALISQTISKI